MDFKSLIDKLDSIEAPKATPQAPKLPDAVKLNEDAELRVLAGTSSILEEAKKMKDAKKKEKVDEGGLDMNLVKAAQKGQEGKPVGKPDPESDKNVKKKYGYRMDGEPAERDDDPTKQERRGRKRQNKGESVELDTEKFQEKFTKMVEAKKGSKPDFLDVDKDGDKKEPMKKASKEAGKGEKKETKGMTAAQKKLPPGLQKAIAKKKGKTESVRASKKVVAESLEPILKFADMIKLVQESGGQQQIDPLDKALFSWATRVAQNKLGEGLKAEVYAGMIYERNGGRFEMYDVLSESKKKINEEADSRVAKLAKLTIQIMEKDGAEVGPGSDVHTIFDVLEQDYRGREILRLVKQLDDADFKTWETMIHDHFMPY